VYPNDAVASFITKHFVPAKFHVKEQPKAFERFNAMWTPTILILDDQGQERHRIEGFLPPDDFRAQLALGLGKAAFAAGRWGEAEEFYQGIVRDLPKSDSAAEALYWAGVSKYKATQDGSALAETGRALKEKYPDSTWAKKGSVWVS
jgi:tetratricopeptide (TPR) repeat protein